MTRRQCYKGDLAAGLMALALILMPAVVLKAGLRFDGKDDSIVIKKNLTEGLSAISITMWVKGEYGGGNLVCNESAVYLHLRSDLLGFFLGRDRDGQGSGYLKWDKDLTGVEWRHLAAVWSSPSSGDGKMKLYIDGIKQGHDLAYSGGTNGILRGKPCLRFCGVFNSCIGAFQGTLEDARVYKRALTDEEVLAVYRGEGSDGVTNGIALWYPLKDKNAELMTEGDVCFVRDRSGNGNQGEIIGAPVWKTIDDDEAAQKRREQIELTCELVERKKVECGKLRQSLAKWFEEHPSGDKKWRARFEELNRGFGWTPDVLRGYDQLDAEVGLKELFPESEQGVKGEDDI